MSSLSRYIRKVSRFFSRYARKWRIQKRKLLGRPVLIAPYIYGCADHACHALNAHPILKAKMQYDRYRELGYDDIDIYTASSFIDFACGDDSKIVYGIDDKDEAIGFEIMHFLIDTNIVLPYQKSDYLYERYKHLY